MISWDMASDSRLRICDLGEDVAIERFVSGLSSQPGVIEGPGDDCAVVQGEGDQCILLKTDCVIEGVHFLEGTDPRRVGRKAMNRVFSDMAAMGGRPRYALITIAVDAERRMEEIEGWYVGLEEASSKFGCAVVGGETSWLRNQGALISVAISGQVECDRLVTRSGARAGDVIAVTGLLGGSFESEKHLDFEPRIFEAEWLTRVCKPTAMMDLSDGLGSDLPRMAKASKCGFRVESSSLPRPDGVSFERALADGEDYELLIAVAPDSWSSLETAWVAEFPDLPLTRIGQMTEKSEQALTPGWDPFGKQ
ncbi:MAG: thiamine-phosphate kinase [Verrucomicrobiota bacterium]